MRVLPLLILTLVVAATACAQPSGVEQRQDLGFGFHRDVIAEPSSFEVAHFEYLFYRSRKLSQIDECAVAPSGKAVVYQDGPSGSIFLFRPGDGKIVRLTRKFVGLAEKFDWHEREGFVSAVVVDRNEKKSTLKLQITPKT